MSQINARYLPGLLRDIADLVGLSSTLDVVRAYGGTRLYIPKKFMPDHPLVKVAGHEAAAKIVEIYGGEHLDLPRGAVAIQAARHEQIRAERASGMTHAKLAVKFGLTERQVRTICKGETPVNSQQSLF